MEFVPSSEVKCWKSGLLLLIIGCSESSHGHSQELVVEEGHCWGLAGRNSGLKGGFLGRGQLVPALQQGGLGERCKLPQWSSGQSPDHKYTLDALRAQKTHLLVVSQFNSVFSVLPVLDSALPGYACKLDQKRYYLQMAMFFILPSFNPGINPSHSFLVKTCTVFPGLVKKNG